jgi:hypothetical protein
MEIRKGIIESITVAIIKNATGDIYITNEINLLIMDGNFKYKLYGKIKTLRLKNCTKIKFENFYFEKLEIINCNFKQKIIFSNIIIQECKKVCLDNFNPTEKGYSRIYIVDCGLVYSKNKLNFNRLTICDSKIYNLKNDTRRVKIINCRKLRYISLFKTKNKFLFRIQIHVNEYQPLFTNFV